MESILTPCCQLYVEKEKASTVPATLSKPYMCIYIGGGCWFVCSLLAVLGHCCWALFSSCSGQELPSGWGTLAFVVLASLVAARGL